MLELSAAIVSESFGRRAKELASLAADWDGEGAEPVRWQALTDGITLVRSLQAQFPDFQIPHIAPTREGSIILEWATDTKYLEVESDEEDWKIVKTLRGHNPRYFTATIKKSDSGIANSYQWLISEREL